MRKPKEETTNSDKPEENVRDSNSNQNEPESGLHDQQQVDNGKETRQNNKTKKITFLGYLKKKESQPIIANMVSIIAVIISGLLAVFTYYLYHIASGQVESVVKAGNAAQSSANTAIKTLEETKAYNKGYIKLQKQIFTSDSLSDVKRQKRDSAALNTQITALNQTQKNFELTNRAYLQISAFDTVRLGKPYAIIAFLISNIGQQPAKIIDGYANMTINIPGLTDRKVISENGREKWLPENSYVITSAPVQKNINLDGVVDINYINQLKSGERDFYIYGKYNYINNATNKKTLYEFYAELSFAHGKIWHMIQSDNTPMK